MKSLAPLLSLALFVLPLSCAAQSALPSARPADFTIRLSQSGGMLPGSTQVTCDAHECVYQHQMNGRGDPRHGAVTAAQIDALYRTVRENAFDRIRMERHELVYDMATTSITVTASGQTYSLSPGATQGVPQRDVPHFNAVRDAIYALLRALQLV